MNYYYLDLTTKIIDFKDVSVLDGKHPQKNYDLTFPRDMIYCFRIIALSNNDEEILSVNMSSESACKMFCINTDVRDCEGRFLHKTVSVGKNTLMPLFFIFDYTNTSVSEDKISIKIITESGTDELAVSVKCTNEKVDNHGFSDLKNLSRLAWLNSDAELNSDIPKPYIPIKNNGLSYDILGRTIEFGSNALPRQVISRFNEAVKIDNNFRYNLFCEPMTFIVGDKSLDYKIISQKNDGQKATLVSNAFDDEIDVKISSALFYEGLLKVSVALSAKKDICLDNVGLSAHLDRYACEYVNGFGEQGGKYHAFKAKFKEGKRYDCIFTGNVNIGMQIQFKAEDYREPFVNIYYHNRELAIPSETWDNHGRGEINVSKSGHVSFNCGKYSMKEGETHSFNVELHFTPFKEFDIKKHCGVKYFQKDPQRMNIDIYGDIDEAASKGFTHIVNHHARPDMPFINYPFTETKELKKEADYIHSLGLGLKLYYTIREHGVDMEEMCAFKALGDEIIVRHKGDGSTWIMNGVSEKLAQFFGDDDFIPAWRVVFNSYNYDMSKYKPGDDATVLFYPETRYENYYIEGLKYLCEEIGVNGIYLDDIQISRTGMERVRKILDKHDGLVDLHSWNHHDERAGDASCINIYTKILPFIDSLWLGEGFDISEKTPDFIMAEMSGLPYGLGGQMLCGGGNIYAGMLYCMNSRYPWINEDAIAEYKLWDEFGIENSEMFGYWHSKVPVGTNDNSVLCTVYLNADKALVCLYNFSDEEKKIKITLNRELLGFNPHKTAIVPEIDGYQERNILNVGEEQLIHRKDGLIFVLNKN